MNSYETDLLRSISYGLRNLNKDMYNVRNVRELLEPLTREIQRANELKEIELGIRKPTDYTFKETEPKTRVRR